MPLAGISATSLPELLRSRDPWQALKRAKPHMLPLVLVLVACAVGQCAVLIQPLSTFQWPDALNYIAVMQEILGRHQFADVLRTPTYPAFIALFYGNAQNYRHLRYAQAGLMVLTTLEVYVLAYRLNGRRWVAAALAALIGMNLFILNWERLILTETLAYWFAVTLFLVLERYVRTRRSTTALLLGIICSLAILTRPIFIYLPATLVVVLAAHALRAGTIRQEWKRLAWFCAGTGSVLVAYMACNRIMYGYFGLSDISNLNLFDIVLIIHQRYGMPVTGAGPQFAQFQQDVNVYVGHGSTDVWTFAHSHPRWDASYWSIYGSYSQQVLLRHPLYLLHFAGDGVFKAWTARPWAWAPYTIAPTWIRALLRIASWEYKAYLALPVLLAGMVVHVWRRPARTSSLVLLAMLVSIASQIVMAGALDFEEYDRLRFPLDWAMFVAFGIIAVELAAFGIEWMRRHGIAARFFGARPIAATGLASSSLPLATGSLPSADTPHRIESELTRVRASISQGPRDGGSGE